MSRDLVVLSLERWDDVWRRNQYLVHGLLEADPQLRVLFVVPSHDVLHAALHGRGLGRGSGLQQVTGYHGRLWQLEPTKVLPRAVGGLADALLVRSVRRALRRLRIDAPVLWVNDPSWASLVRAEPHWPALYDVTDDWLAAERPERELERLRSNEAVLLERARAVVVCSAALAVSKGADREVVHVPNAVDVARYRRPLARPDDLPAGGTAVYVGTLHQDRLDVEVTGRTAERLRADGATLVLVGPNLLAGEHTSALERRGAVILGGRSFDRVPAYLQHATALVVPHLVTPFTDSLDPIKLYEYLAVGRPVVSTPVAGFRELSIPGVHVVPPTDFAEAVAHAVSEDPATVEHSGVPDWSARVEQMASVLALLR